MTAEPAATFTAFMGHRKIAAGDLAAVAILAKAEPSQSVLVFDDASGRLKDIDPRDTPAPEAAAETSRRGPGRPKLGVAAREVTLLPRQWDWLARQPGGASATLRRLVDEARKSSETRDRPRLAREAAYHFMTALAGDLPGYEEAARALFAGDGARFEIQTQGWPEDIRSYALSLAGPGLEPKA
jgi:hypothetical protein